MTVVEVLRAARKRIEFAWVQDTKNLGDPDDACCAVTATMYLGDNSSQESEADALVAQAIGVPTHRVPRWNDAPGRTQAEVLAAFDKAIALAEAAP